jgi:hypothetical protein
LIIDNYLQWVIVAQPAGPGLITWIQPFFAPIYAIKVMDIASTSNKVIGFQQPKSINHRACL